MMKFPSKLSLLLVATAALAVNGFTNQLARTHIGRKTTVLASTPNDQDQYTTLDDAFILRNFATDIDDNNSPPSLKIILRNIKQLTHQGSDIRGKFVDHPRLGRIAQASKAIEKLQEDGIPALTPFSSFCLGHAFGQLVLQQTKSTKPTVALGRDPRPHGTILCDAFGRGVQSASENIRVVYTGVATTPSLFHFCRAGFCDGAVMVTASHLPSDRNGFKLFTANGGFQKNDVRLMNGLAADFAQKWHDVEGMMPPTSGGEGVFCSEWVDFMPYYASTLQEAICKEVGSASDKPLQGLKIVLNAGNGSGGFFNKVLEGLGADVSASIGIEPDGTFPRGIPNPEKKQMMADTIAACQEVEADLGILLDTDADRSGFVVPVGNNQYEPLNRNRLIALLSVVFSRTSPGCAIVTDSVTSEGLADFLENDLGLQHVRYLKGYANVIGKAQALTTSGNANAEMAIETSGHCAMKENGYLDDGTYTAVKVIGLLAREKMASHDDKSADLLSLISGLKEMPEDTEVRMNANDGSLDTTTTVFDRAVREIEDMCSTMETWDLDNDNLEGIRVRIGGGGFFMFRKSLHDPLVSLQVEAQSKQEALKKVVGPLLERFQSVDVIGRALDLTNLEQY